MLDTYRTVSLSSRIEVTEKKSRFLGFCQPLASESEAQNFIGGIRRAFPDASHHVFAWILGGEQNLQRFSDDGEPQGTAGKPVIEILIHNRILQAGIVVVRYFGGTLLGSGGLTRTYGRAAGLALEARVPVTMRLCDTFKITISYADLDHLRRLLERAGAWLLDSRFGLDAELTAAVPHGSGDSFYQICADASRGAALIEPAGFGYQVLPPPDPPQGGQFA